MRLSWTSGHDVLESSPDLDWCGNKDQIVFVGALVVTKYAHL